jgi:hemerythrin-like domain-containing protein
MPDTLALWHAEHVNFARLLNLLEDQLSLFHTGAQPDYDLVLNIMFYMTHYSDVLHHPKEDLVFDKIREREPAVGRTVDDLVRQHVRLKHIGETLVQRLDDLLNGSVVSRAEIEGAARDYVGTMRGHMRIEESELLPLAAKHLTAKDWTAIHAKVGRIEDPLFGKNPQHRYAELAQQIARYAVSDGVPMRGA